MSPTQAACSLSRTRSVPAGRSQMRSVPSLPAEASHDSSGARAIWRTFASLPDRILTVSRCARSQTRMEVSSEALITVFPSWRHTTLRTESVCPWRWPWKSPVARSQMPIVPSLEAERMRWPSGCTATPLTVPRWPWRVRSSSGASWCTGAPSPSPARVPRIHHPRSAASASAAVGSSQRTRRARRAGRARGRVGASPARMARMPSTTARMLAGRASRSFCTMDANSRSRDAGASGHASRSRGMGSRACASSICRAESAW